MPTSRAYIPRQQLHLGGIELIHLMTGCCLIGSGCSLCTVHGDTPGHFTWVLDIPRASELWRQHRDELLATWHERLVL